MRIAILACLLLAACELDPNSAINVPQDVKGVVVEVHGNGLEDVDSFTLKSGDETYELFISDEVEYGFPLSHLRSHQRAGEPVVVRMREEEGRLIAVSIEDAAEAP